MDLRIVIMKEVNNYIFCNILDVYQNIQYENLHQNEMAKTIATAYMTKKNIPKKVLTVMENTSFKKYFKYVEFDEEVNLNSVKIIEKEFKVLNEAYFSSKAFFDVTLRFRKLGKYNIHYFFRRAEIFARCGEIYFVRILKVERSLIQPDLKYAYSKSEQLDTLIKNYYEDLLNVKLKHSNFSIAV